MATKRVQQRRESKKSPQAKPQADGLTPYFPDKRSAFWWTAALSLLHSAALLMLFDPLQGLLNSAPLIDQDWGLHFHHLLSMEQFWRQDKQLWGYNPLFMAGYPSNTIQDLSIKLFEFLALLLSAVALTPIQWFKLLAFCAVASVPWLVYFTARNFWSQEELKIIASPWAALLGTAYWWNSLPREMFFYGMIGFPLACYVALWGVSLVYRMARQSTSWSGTIFGWLVFALIIPSLHIQAAIIFVPPLMALLVFERELLRSRDILWILGAALVTLVVNWVWLAPAVAHLKDDVSASIVEQLSLFVSADPLTFLKDYLGPKHYWSFRSTWAEKGLRLMLLALGGIGVVHLLRSRQKSLGAILAATLATLFLIAYLGSLLPVLKAWQPLRFKVAYDLCLSLAAAYTVACSTRQRVLLSGASVTCALIFGGVMFLFNLAATESLGKMQLRTLVRPEITGIVDWIKAESPANARVLFEESGDETGFIYDGMYLSSFVAHWTGRELIGGPINLYNERHHFAEFHSGKLFQKEIHRLSDAEISNYFRLYNIGAVVAFHPESIRRLESLRPLVSPARRIGPAHLMKVNQPFTWYIQGAGNVAAALGRIYVRDAKDREIILKYHWVEGLKGLPAVTMVPVKIQDDPIPFIKIIDPPATFTLQISK